MLDGHWAAAYDRLGLIRATGRIRFGPVAPERDSYAQE